MAGEYNSATPPGSVWAWRDSFTRSSPHTIWEEGALTCKPPNFFALGTPSDSPRLAPTCPARRTLGLLNHRLRCRANQEALRHQRAPGKGKSNLPENSSESQDPGRLSLPQVTELTRASCAKPPGSGGSPAPRTCLLCGRRNYISQGDAVAKWSEERLFQLRPRSRPEPGKCCWRPTKGPPRGRGRG